MRPGTLQCTVLSEPVLENSDPMPSADRYEITTEPIRYKARPMRATGVSDSKNDENRRGDDQPQVFAVVVAGITQGHRQTGHRDRCVCQAGIPAARRAVARMSLDLVHRFRVERIQLALNQIPGGVAVSGEEDGSGFLELVAGEDLWWDVKPAIDGVFASCFIISRNVEAWSRPLPSFLV